MRGVTEEQGGGDSGGGPDPGAPRTVIRGCGSFTRNLPMHGRSAVSLLGWQNLARPPDVSPHLVGVRMEIYFSYR